MKRTVAKEWDNDDGKRMERGQRLKNGTKTTAKEWNDDNGKGMERRHRQRNDIYKGNLWIEVIEYR